jgi:hypothetical protein
MDILLNLSEEIVDVADVDVDVAVVKEQTVN